MSKHTKMCRRMNNISTPSKSKIEHAESYTTASITRSLTWTNKVTEFGSTSTIKVQGMLKHAWRYRRDDLFKQFSYAITSSTDDTIF